MYASRVRCVLFKGNERVDILDKKEVDKGIIGNIEFAFNYLKEHVPVRFEIKGLKRIEYPQFHEDAYREAIVNAVIHRGPTPTHFFVKMKTYEHPSVDRIKYGVKYGVKDGVNDGVKLSKTQKKLLYLISEDKNITRGELSEKIGISIRNIEKNIAKLKEKGLLTRVGPDKNGYWKLLTDIE
jgi:predicted HTH transcriptional regulator